MNEKLHLCRRVIAPSRTRRIDKSSLVRWIALALFLGAKSHAQSEPAASANTSSSTNAPVALPDVVVTGFQRDYLERTTQTSLGI